MRLAPESSRKNRSDQSEKKDKAVGLEDDDEESMDFEGGLLQAGILSNLLIPLHATVGPITKVNSMRLIMNSMRVFLLHFQAKFEE